jgi:hypothetical protein
MKRRKDALDASLSSEILSALLDGRRDGRQLVHGFSSMKMNEIGCAREESEQPAMRMRQNRVQRVSIDEGHLR